MGHHELEEARIGCYPIALWHITHFVAPTATTIAWKAEMERQKMGRNADMSNAPFQVTNDHSTKKRIETTVITVNSLGQMVNGLRREMAEAIESQDSVDHAFYLNNPQYSVLIPALELYGLRFFDANQNARVASKATQREINEIRCREHPVATVTIPVVNLEIIARSHIDSLQLAMYVTKALTMFENFRITLLSQANRDKLVEQTKKIIGLTSGEYQFMEGSVWRRYKNFGYVAVAHLGATFASMARPGVRRELTTFINRQKWKPLQKAMADDAVRNLVDVYRTARGQLYLALFEEQPNAELLDIIERAFLLDDNQSLLVEFLGFNTGEKLALGVVQANRLFNLTGHVAYLRLATILYEMAYDAGLTSVMEFAESRFVEYGAGISTPADSDDLIKAVRAVDKPDFAPRTFTSSELPILGEASVKSFNIRHHPTRRGIYLINFILTEEASNGTDEALEIHVAVDLNSRDVGSSIITCPDDHSDESDYARGVVAPAITSAILTISTEAVKKIQAISTRASVDVQALPREKGERRGKDQKKSVIRRGIRKGRQEDPSLSDDNGDDQIRHEINLSGAIGILPRLDKSTQTRVIRSLKRFNDRGTRVGLRKLRLSHQYSGPTLWRIKSGDYRIILEEIEDKNPGVMRFQIIDVRDRKDRYEDLIRS
ncbi:hypothetical protein A3B46_02305 [Candidatus Roizmanbacteria bacterium RIFCSPLOWO2_01_FULL_39_19]|nr:MAG: hypothetical protein A3B46_02305 [Candidatus Roizmanbacteria bacterium RIFCSPLOWO2_01_FULL_39_19]